MKAFITGVGGFVGPYLVRHLVERGFEVFGIDRKGSTVEGCVVEACNVTDYDSLFSIIRRIKPEYLFHLAGQSSVAKSWDEPELTKEINVGGAKNLFAAAAAAKLPSRILLVSSAEVYGLPKKLPMAENHPIAPITPYGESKVEQETLAQEYVKKHALRIIIARSFNHTGPGQPPDFVCSSFAMQFADIEKGRQPPVIKVGDLAIKRDFSDVRDVVRAYLLLLQKGVNGEAYNVCSGTTVAIGDVVDKLKKMSTASVKVEREQERMKHTVVPVLHGDNSKLKLLGWQPLISFDETLASLLYHWRKK